MSTHKVFAIGGGELDEKSRGIYRRLLEITRVKNPRVLFLGAASLDSLEYYQGVKSYLEPMGFSVDQMCMESLMSAPVDDFSDFDIIYAGGGDTTKLVDILLKSCIQKLLNRKKPLVFSGISAGANCWFEWGFCEGNDGHSWVKGLGLVPGVCIPHFDPSTNIHLHLPSDCEHLDCFPLADYKFKEFDAF